MANRLDTELLITAGVDGLNHVDNLISSIDAAGGNTDQLRNASEQLRREWSSLTTAEQAERMRNLGNATNNAAADVGLLERNTAAATSTFDKMKGAVMALGAALGLAFIIGKIQSFFTDAISGAADFEQQLATVQAVSGATVEQMQRIKVASEELGKSTSYNATQAAEGFEVLARAGLNVENSLKTIPSVLALAQGNGLDLAEAAGYITNSVQGMGLSFADAGRVTDVLAKAASSANTDVAGMGAALSYAAPSAAALGVTIEETAAYVGKFADAGIDASRAGTSLNGMLSQFSNSTSSFRRELANIGITTNDFNDAIRQLAATGPVGQKAINALGMEAGPALKALLSQGMDSLDGLTDKLNNASGTAQAQADTMGNTFTGAFAGLSSAWDSLKNKLGETFLGTVTQSFRDISTEINTLVSSGKISQFGTTVATVFGEMTTYVINFVRNVDMAAILDKVSTSLDTLRGISTATNGAFQALSIVFSAFKAGVLAVGVAVSMVITVVVELNKIALDAGRGIAGFFGITSTTADGMSSAMGSALQASEDFRNFATAEIANASTSINDSFNSIAGTAESTAIDASNTLTQIPNEYANAVDAVQQQTTDAFNDILTAATDTGTQAATAATDIREQVASMMAGFDQPEQFAALINSITATGQEAVVGADLLEQMGVAAARGGAEAQVAAEKASAAYVALGGDVQKMADAANDSINNAFEALDIDVAQSLSGVNSKTQQTFDLIAVGAKSIGDSAYDAADKAKLLSALFANGMGAAKTAEEFKVLNDMVAAHGLTSVVTAEQAAALKVGMQGGAEAVKTAAESQAAQTAELDKNADATAKNSAVSQDNASAKKEQADAADKAAAAVAKSTQNESASLAIMQQITGTIKNKISALEQMGATTEQVDSVWNMLTNSMNGTKFLGIQDFANSMQRVDDAVSEQITSFENAKNKAEEMTRALGGNAVTSRDLVEAQHALRKATDANVQGMVRLDQATLDNLKDAIDQTKKKMQDLADEAKDTAQRLEGELAKIRGDDSKALEIEQAKELKKIEELLADARKRGNAEEIKYYNEALTLQKEINKEERKQARDSERQSQQSSTPQSATRQSNSNTSNTTSSTGSNNNAVEVVDALDARIEAAKKQAAAEAVENFAQQLKDEAKRRT